MISQADLEPLSAGIIHDDIVPGFWRPDSWTSGCLGGSLDPRVSSRARLALWSHPPRFLGNLNGGGATAGTQPQKAAEGRRSLGVLGATAELSGQ